METSYSSARKGNSLWGNILLHVWLIVCFDSSLVSSYSALYFFSWFVSYLDSFGYAGLQHHFYAEQKSKLIQTWFVTSLVSSYLVFTYLVFWFVSYLDSYRFAGLQHHFNAEVKNKLIQINEQVSQNAFNLSYFWRYYSWYAVFHPSTVV